MENNDKGETQPNDWPTKKELDTRQVDTTNKTHDKERGEGYDSIDDERERLMFAENRRINKEKDNGHLSNNHEANKNNGV